MCKQFAAWCILGDHQIVIDVNKQMNKYIFWMAKSGAEPSA